MLNPSRPRLRGENGTVLMLMPVAVLIMFVLAAITVDLTAVRAGQQLTPRMTLRPQVSMKPHFDQDEASNLIHQGFGSSQSRLWRPGASSTTSRQGPTSQSTKTVRSRSLFPNEFHISSRVPCREHRTTNSYWRLRPPLCNSADFPPFSVVVSSVPPSSP